MKQIINGFLYLKDIRILIMFLILEGSTLLTLLFGSKLSPTILNSIFFIVLFLVLTSISASLEYAFLSTKVAIKKRKIKIEEIISKTFHKIFLSNFMAYVLFFIIILFGGVFYYLFKTLIDIKLVRFFILFIILLSLLYIYFLTNLFQIFLISEEANKKTKSIKEIYYVAKKQLKSKIFWCLAIFDIILFFIAFLIMIVVQKFAILKIIEVSTMSIVYTATSFFVILMAMILNKLILFESVKKS